MYDSPAGVPGDGSKSQEVVPAAHRCTPLSTAAQSGVSSHENDMRPVTLSPLSFSLGETPAPSLPRAASHSARLGQSPVNPSHLLGQQPLPHQESDEFAPFSENLCSASTSEAAPENLLSDARAEEALRTEESEEALALPFGNLDTGEMSEGAFTVPFEETLRTEEQALTVPFRNLDTGEVLTIEQLPRLPLRVSLPSASRASPHSPREAAAVPAQPGTDVLCCGYLWKRGKATRALARRWYVLRHGGLCYYASAQESYP